MNRLALTALVGLGLTAFSPSLGQAEGQGSCKVVTRVCEFGGAGCRDNNGDRGSCRQIGNQCTCFTPNDGAKENAINTIFDSSTAAVVVVEDPGLPKRCEQVGALIGNMIMSARRLSMELAPIRFVEPTLLKRVDLSMARLPGIVSFVGSSCGMTVPGNDIGDALDKAKDELLEQLAAEFDGTIVK